MGDEDLLASIDRGRAAQREHVALLQEHAGLMGSGVDALAVWERRLALESALGTLRTNYTNAELQRFGVAMPSALSTTDPAQSIVLAVRGDLQDSIELSRNLRTTVRLWERIKEMEETSRLERVAREALKTAGIAAEGAANIVDRFLKVVGDAAPAVGSWGVVAVVVIVLILIRKK